MNNAPLQRTCEASGFFNGEDANVVKVHKSSSIAGTVWDNKIITEEQKIQKICLTLLK